MRYIEPHAHMVSRTTDDYEKLVTAGCEAICEPAFWAGFDQVQWRVSVTTTLSLLSTSPRGQLSSYTTLHLDLLNPKESEDLSLAKDVLEIIPEFLDKPNVLGKQRLD